MELFELSLCLCAITACVLLTVTLLVWRADEETAPVRSSCPLAALVSFLYAVLFGTVFWVTPFASRPRVIDVSFLLIYVAHLVLTVAMKRLLQGTPLRRRQKSWLLLPVLAVWALAFFAELTVARMALAMLTLLGIVGMTISLGIDLRQHAKRKGYDQDVRKFEAVVFVFYILIGVLSWVMALLQGMAFLVAAWLLTAMSVGLSVWFYNRQNVYLPHFSTNDVEPMPVAEEPEEPTEDEEVPLSLRLVRWERLESRPYLEKSLTLKKVAEQLDTTPRLLSEYINRQLGVNFNTYVNQLRVRYVEQELKEHPEARLQDLASKAGFTDSSALLRVMKKMAENS